MGPCRFGFQYLRRGNTCSNKYFHLGIIWVSFSMASFVSTFRFWVLILCPVNVERPQL